MRATMFVVFALAACVTPRSHLCDDGLTCPEGLLCDEANKGCVKEEQFTACAGKENRTACNTMPTGPGTCHSGVCLEASCGNGRLDLVEDELCDDGNEKDGDMCSADCSSTLVCGNGITDLSRQETCDDTNAVSYDGCDSLCQVERVGWVKQTTPTNDLWFASAYDASRGKAVVFNTLTLAMHEWDGEWHARAVSDLPPQRNLGVIVYDHARREVILHGGSTGNNGVIGETWAWNGVRWTHLVDGPPVASQAMAYDAKNKRTILFGGYDNNGALTKTWAFDGTAWTDISPATSPPARRDSVMAYDPKRAVIVLFGGQAYGTQTWLDDVWEFDGTAWTNKTPASGNPAGVTLATLTWDEPLQKLVLFGGQTNSTGSVTNAMSMWDGTSWSTFSGTKPAARSRHVMVDANGTLLLFGGIDGTGATLPGTVSLFDGAAWSTATSRPSARAHMASANAPTQYRFVQFGGDTGSTVSRETWELGRSGWKMVNPGTGVAPPQLVDERMVFDVGRNLFVLFGGSDSVGGQASAVWELGASNTWSSTTPATAPAGRSFPVLVYDAARKETVMYGGGIIMSSAYYPQDDMWTWNGSTWTQKHPMTQPPKLFGAAAGYDWGNQTVVVFDGDASASTRVWDGTDWTLVTTPIHPSARPFGTLVWHPARHSLVLTGGSSGLMDAWEWIGHSTSPPTGEWHQIPAGVPPAPRAYQTTGASLDGTSVFIGYGDDGSPIDDPWTLGWSGNLATESCLDPVDRDGDSLAGCDDPDCWSVCTPQCPPGTPCSTPKTCGNGVCDPTDNCGLCASDCPTACAAACGDFICSAGETCPGDCTP